MPNNFDINSLMMTFLDTLIGSTGLIKAFFIFFMNLPQENSSSDFESWLNEDGFKNNPEDDDNKKHLFRELNRLKDVFRKDLDDRTPLKDKNGNQLTPAEIIRLVESHKNRISKVRLMIQHEILQSYNLHKPSGVKYIVLRSYWIDRNGKKFRKFSKNLGPADNVLVNGKIPNSTMIETEREFDRLMWDLYKTEYSD